VMGVGNKAHGKAQSRTGKASRAKVGARSQADVMADPMASDLEIFSMGRTDPQAAMLHPNCPPELWMALAAEYGTSAAMNNPAADLFIMDDPVQWGNLAPVLERQEVMDTELSAARAMQIIGPRSTLTDGQRCVVAWELMRNVALPLILLEEPALGGILARYGYVPDAVSGKPRTELRTKIGATDDPAANLRTFIGHLSVANQNRFAADCAEHVLPIFEDKYPRDKRPREAIDVRRLFADGKATKEQWTFAQITAKVACHDAFSFSMSSEAMNVVMACYLEPKKAVTSAAEAAATAALHAALSAQAGTPESVWSDEEGNPSADAAYERGANDELAWQWNRLQSYLSAHGQKVSGKEPPSTVGGVAPFGPHNRPSPYDFAVLSALEKSIAKKAAGDQWMSLTQAADSQADLRRIASSTDRASKIFHAFGLLNPRDQRLVAVYCAERVAPIVEGAFPEYGVANLAIAAIRQRAFGQITAEALTQKMLEFHRTISKLTHKAAASSLMDETRRGVFGHDDFTSLHKRGIARRSISTLIEGTDANANTALGAAIACIRAAGFQAGDAAKNPESAKSLHQHQMLEAVKYAPIAAGLAAEAAYREKAGVERARKYKNIKASTLASLTKAEAPQIEAGAKRAGVNAVDLFEKGTLEFIAEHLRKLHTEVEELHAPVSGKTAVGRQATPHVGGFLTSWLLKKSVTGLIKMGIKGGATVVVVGSGLLLDLAGLAGKKALSLYEARQEAREVVEQVERDAKLREARHSGGRGAPAHAPRQATIGLKDHDVQQHLTHFVKAHQGIPLEEAPEEAYLRWAEDPEAYRDEFMAEHSLPGLSAQEQARVDRAFEMLGTLGLGSKKAISPSVAFTAEMAKEFGDKGFDVTPEGHAAPSSRPLSHEEEFSRYLKEMGVEEIGKKAPKVAAGARKKTAGTGSARVDALLVQAKDIERRMSELMVAPTKAKKVVKRSKVAAKVGKKKGSHAHAGYVVDLDEAAAGIGAKTEWEEQNEEALFTINRAGTMRRFLVMDHARKSMRERHIKREDIRHGLMMARDIEWQDDRWRVVTQDRDGDRLGIVCVVLPDGEVQVMTVF